MVIIKEASVGIPGPGDIGTTEGSTHSIPERIKPFLSDEPLTSFPWNTKIHRLKHIKTAREKGVKYDEYIFTGDSRKKLRILKIQPGFSSPSQELDKNTETVVEGHIWGDGEFKFSRVNSGKPKEEIEQFHRDDWTELCFYDPGDKGNWFAKTNSPEQDSVQTPTEDQSLVIFQLSISKRKPGNIKQ